MSRRLSVETRESGRLEILALVEDAEGRWEAEWEDLRQTRFGQLISRVPRSAYNHLLNGFSQPFVHALGLPPDGALQKLPSHACAKQAGCSLYKPRCCTVLSKKLPWCYEPEGLEGASGGARRRASDLVFLWKEQVYVVAIYDD